MTGKNWLRSAVALALLGTAGAAIANTATLTVNATVAASCTVATATLAFGSVTLAADRDADTNLLVRCNNGTAFNVSLGAGQNALAGQRRMSNGTQFLAYDLYTTSARTTAWTTAIQVPGSGTGLGTDVVIPVYGRIPAGANATAPTGAYADAVTITVTL